MLKRVFLCLVVPAVILWNSSLCSAEDVFTVDEEVVTGSRIYTELDELPAPTYVVTREEIEKNSASKLSEILSSFPGISTRTRAGNTQEEFIEIRGLRTEVLFLVDGMPYYKTSHVAGAAAVDLRSLPMENIERIEVIKGAGSAVYGSMAAAGVINIITRKPGDQEISVSITSGSNERKEGSFWVSLPGEKLNSSIWFSHREEGKSPLLEYSTYEGTVQNHNLDHKNDTGGVSLSSGPVDFSATWGEYSSKWTYGNDPEEQENTFARYVLRYKGAYDSFKIYLDRQDKDVFQYGAWTNVEDRSWGAEYSRQEFYEKFLMSWGMAYRKEDMKYLLSDYAINYEMKRHNYAPFVEFSVPVGDLVMDAGIRYELWDQDGAEDHQELIPRIAFSYQNGAGNLWYLSAGRFFAMPSLYQLSYFDNYYAKEPNRDLIPEEGWSYELGMKGSGTRGNWNIGLFYLDMNDKIDILPDYSRYVNIAEFRSWGIEAGRKWILSDLWDLSLSAAWMNSEQRDGSSAEWIRGGTPEWDVETAIAYNRGPFSGELSMNYLGNREDQRVGIGPGSQEDVTTFDAILSYETAAGIFKLQGYNIFDEEYYLQDYTSWGTTTRYYGPEARFYLSWEHRF